LIVNVALMPGKLPRLRWGGKPGRNSTAAKALLDAVMNDPLLPGRILPSDYLEQQAWRRRVEVLRDAGRQLRTFNPETTGAGRA
jgi:hypothetical protein